METFGNIQNYIFRIEEKKEICDVLNKSKHITSFIKNEIKRKEKDKKQWLNLKAN